MSDRELYQKTFAQVHSAVSIRWEDYAHRKKRRHVTVRIS